MQILRPHPDRIYAGHEGYARRLQRVDKRTFLLQPDWRYGLSGSRQHYLIEALLDGRVIGRAFGWYERSGQFVLEKIELDPAHRSKGYGTRVLEQLRAQARKEQCTELLIKGVRTDNQGAIRLYASLGAVRVPASAGLYCFVISPP